MKDKNRILTPKEEKRKERFEALRERLNNEGYESKELTISILQANVQGILTSIPFVVVLMVLFLWCGNFSSVEFEYSEMLIVYLLMIVAFVVHELIHGITWGIFAENHLKSIEFGIILSMLTPYCTCAEPMKKWQYIMGTAMPTIILGGGVGIASIVTGNLPLCVLAAIMIIAGSGDFLIILKILCYRTQKKDVIFCDHPYEGGVVVFEK